MSKRTLHPFLVFLEVGDSIGVADDVCWSFFSSTDLKEYMITGVNTSNRTFDRTGWKIHLGRYLELSKQFKRLYYILYQIFLLIHPSSSTQLDFQRMIVHQWTWLSRTPVSSVSPSKHHILIYFSVRFQHFFIYWLINRFGNMCSTHSANCIVTSRWKFHVFHWFLFRTDWLYACPNEYFPDLFGFNSMTLYYYFCPSRWSFFQGTFEWRQNRWAI